MPNQTFSVAQAALVLDSILSRCCEIYTAKLDRKDQYKLFAVYNGGNLLDLTPYIALMAHERLYADGGIRGGIRRIEPILERLCDDLGHRPSFTIVELN